MVTNDDSATDEPGAASATNGEPPTDETEANVEPPADEPDERPAENGEPPTDESDSEPVEPTAGTASRMEATAARAWKPFIAIGFAIVLISFVVGLRASFTAGDYYGFGQVTREAAGMGSDLAGKRAWIESTKVWLPAFKLLGVGMLLGGVSLLLATILATLRDGGREAQQALGDDVRLMEPPMTAKMFPWLMAVGMMMLIVALVIGIVVARLSFDYWDHSIVDNLDPATKGLLKDLRAIETITLWLEPLKFVGLALILTSIGLALSTVARTLRWQTDRIREMLS